VPDPEPEIKAPEPVEAPVEPTVAEGPTTHPLYVANERARMIAIEQTRCFGFYSERAKTCDSCPLAGLCFAARGGKVAEANARAEEKAREASLAATVVNALGDTSEAADEAAAKRKVWEDAAASLSASVSEAEAAEAIASVLDEADSTPEETPEETPEVMIPTVGNTVQLPFGVICSHCGEQTEKFTDVFSVEGKGTYHMGCASHAV
jgi:adenine-specific DNA glycosylase